MPNGVHKSSNEFEASTRVMESGLLRVLTDESSGTEADPATDASSSTSPLIEIVVAEPVVEEVAKQLAPELPAAAVAPPTVLSTPPAPAKPAAAPPRRGSRVFLVAGVVAAIVLAFDASLFLFHQRHVAPPVAAPSAPDPMPRYMVLPLGTPAAPIEEAQAEAAAPTPAPPTTTVVATAVPNPMEAPVHAHRHSHHRHASH